MHIHRLDEVQSRICMAGAKNALSNGFPCLAVTESYFSLRNLLCCAIRFYEPHLPLKSHLGLFNDFGNRFIRDQTGRNTVIEKCMDFYEARLEAQYAHPPKYQDRQQAEKYINDIETFIAELKPVIQSVHQRWKEKNPGDANPVIDFAL